MPDTTDIEQASFEIVAVIEKYDARDALPAIFNVLDAGITSGDLCPDCVRLLIGRLLERISECAGTTAHAH